MRIIEKLNSWIERAETIVLVFVLGIMVIFAFLQVILRNIFHEGILWGDIFLRHLVLWVGFLGASLATRKQKHINIDLFSRFLSDKGKTVVRFVTNLFSVFICYLLANASWTFVQDEQMMGTEIFADVPAWYFQIIIPIGFFLMSFRFLILALENIVEVFRTQKGGDS
ncbi:MAG: TRAP transporter small permease [Calditrichia bacterium]|jgi:TRAP-type C4-dicarboxylate transport system permease small subunit|nr:TRAP transporter small permease [Calditrichia bacterium]